MVARPDGSNDRRHLGERDLTRWAHDVIGHERSDELEGLVSLDDEYEIAEAIGGDLIERVDAQVRAEVERLISRSSTDP